jgi:hypothetical protein
MPGEFHVNERNIHVMLRSPHGPAGRDLARRLRRVEARAKALCPVDTGRLRSTIRVVGPYSTATGVEGKVGTATVYAPAIHEGRGSRFAPPSWHTHGPGPRRFLKNALIAAR